MKKYLILLTLAFTFSSCESFFRNGTDIDVPESGEQLDFNLFDEINVNVTMPDGTYCLLFTSYPYVDGELVAQPIMTAIAPFSKTVKVAKAVDKLYMYANGNLLEYPRTDINLSSIETKTGSFTPASLRADEEPMSVTQIPLSDELVTAINAYYPEGVINVWDEKIQMSSDLVAPDGVKEIVVNPDGSTKTTEWGNTKVWITYVTNGGSNMNGSLWYYTYEVNEDKSPKTKLQDLQYVQIFDKIAPEGKGTRVYLGEFEPGTRIGFKFEGNATYNGDAYPKYSTPYYNGQAYKNRSENGSKTHTIDGKQITRRYEDYKANDYACGVIRTWEYGDMEYATLGMENRLPSEGTWDGDFNDMICLLEATPLVVENTIDPPVVPVYNRFIGYWLFEDNYPAKGDYDFNDLVVKYEIVETAESAAATFTFAAKGATFINSFGINGNLYYSDLQGYENVYANQDAVEPAVKTMALRLSSNYIPMLNNGKVSFDLETFNEDDLDFPCVLEVPIIDDSKFQWPLEGVRITTAYPRYQAWVDSGCSLYGDWYTDTPVTGTTWNKE